MDRAEKIVLGFSIGLMGAFFCGADAGGPPCCH